MTKALKTAANSASACAIAVVLAAGAVALPGVASAAGTVAGTPIDNTATATYTVGTANKTIDSNTVSFKVDELLDVSVSSDDPGDVDVTTPDTDAVLTYTVTNGGNGPEAFTLAAIANRTADNFDPASYAIYLDTDNDGNFDPATDTLYVPGSNDPVLAPDDQVRVFIVSTIPGGLADGNRAEVALTATAKTGSGTPGTVIAGGGTGGVNAVVGATGARGEDSGYYAVSDVTVALAKSAVVTNAYNSAEPIPGATITYTIVAKIMGSGVAKALVIGDSIPAGTTYVPGTLTLDGAPQTDAADGDKGSFAANAVAVNLGDVIPDATRTIAFKVMINN